MNVSGQGGSSLSLTSFVGHSRCVPRQSVSGHNPHVLYCAALVNTNLCWLAQGGKAEVQIGSTSKQPVLDVTPEIFTLRKLLPQTGNYDFNVHIMDFRPGEYLYVKVLHTLCHFGVCPAHNGCICSRLHPGLAANLYVNMSPRRITGCIC